MSHDNIKKAKLRRKQPSLTYLLIETKEPMTKIVKLRKNKWCRNGESI